MKPALTLLAALLLAPLAGIHAVEPGSASKPSVIVILANDLGWADLSCCGSTFHESPHLDKLAAQGMRFAQAYSGNSPTSGKRRPGARKRATAEFKKSRLAQVSISFTQLHGLRNSRRC